MPRTSDSVITVVAKSRILWLIGTAGCLFVCVGVVLLLAVCVNSRQGSHERTMLTPLEIRECIGERPKTFSQLLSAIESRSSKEHAESIANGGILKLWGRDRLVAILDSIAFDTKDAAGTPLLMRPDGSMISTLPAKSVREVYPIYRTDFNISRFGGGNSKEGQGWEVFVGHHDEILAWAKVDGARYIHPNSDFR